VRLALIVYAVQLALNLSWSFVFFGARLIGPALVVIGALIVAIVVNAVLFWRIERVAGALLVPYAAWVAFAAVLNAALWRLN
jgi:tryptophan-rich sensory protein